jgi:bilirubin oxidase
MMSSTYTDDATGADIDYYEVEVKSGKKQIYPDLPATTLFTYDGLQPGPTFIMHKGRGRPYAHQSFYGRALTPA